MGLLGQEPIDLFFDEFCISFNRSNVQNNNTDDRYGFGLGVYHTFRSENRINIIFGWEYNRTSQFKKVIYGGHYYHKTNVTYLTNYLSFPLGFRFNIGSKTRLYFEAGGFADLATGGKYFGTQHTYTPDENNRPTYKETQFERKGGVPSSFGVYCGIGIIVPISRFELLLSPDYKIGLNELKSSTSRQEFQNKYFRLLLGLRIN